MQAVVVFAGASWVVLQVVDMMIERIGLPEWIFPAILILLVVGLLVVVATAWVQSRPSTTEAEIRGELPGDWEVAPRQAMRDLLGGHLPHLTWGRTALGGAILLASTIALGGIWMLITGRPRQLVNPVNRNDLRCHRRVPYAPPAAKASSCVSDVCCMTASDSCV